MSTLVEKPLQSLFLKIVPPSSYIFGLAHPVLGSQLPPSQLMRIRYLCKVVLSHRRDRETFVSNNSFSKFTITAGSLSYQYGQETTKQIVTATKYFRHPDYNPMFVDNDIGIIQPSTAFTWNDNVTPIRLPSYAMGEDMMTGKTATISGWGITDDSFPPQQPRNLLFAEMVINDGSACYNLYGNVWIPTKICFDTSKDQKSTCQGDSGGPLVIQEEDGKWTEIGLTSFGAADGCAKGLPVAFTRVASHLEFIETITNIEARD